MKLEERIQILESENKKFKEILGFLINNGLSKGNIKSKNITQFAEVFPEWKPGTHYEINTMVAYGKDVFTGTDKVQLYLVNYTHTSQERFKPGCEDGRPGTPAYTPIKI